VSRLPSDHAPPLLADLIDDAAALSPASESVTAVVADHRHHLSAWYADLLGPLLLPASWLDTMGDPPDVPRFGVVGDTGLAGVTTALSVASRWPGLCRFEIAVARRGEDPAPGLRMLLAAAAEYPDVDFYAETPLTWGLMAALDAMAVQRAAGVRIAPKFRTGGLAAELFPTPIELAAVICACQERQLPFKLTAGLHRALRHIDPETGFTHHGFLNVLAGVLAASDGEEVAEVAEVLASTDPLPLIETVRTRQRMARPLWKSFDSGGVGAPLGDLVCLGLVTEGTPA